MDFPQHIETVLDRYGVKPATKAALYDLYSSLGSNVLEAFATMAEGTTSVAAIEPEQVAGLRAVVVESYVRRNHPHWLEGRATPSLWYPRSLEGRASGLLLPLGELSEGGEELGGNVHRVLSRSLPEGQPIPEGVVVFGKNAHYGGRLETISFDVVPFDLESAVACALALGQQHTVPGSIGETSGTVDMIGRSALLWETQPNVLKPAGERNQAISKLWRRHRNWHVATLTAAILWSLRQDLRLFILRGSALSAAHEVNTAKPVTDDIMRFHDRTVETVVDSIGGELVPLSAEDESFVGRSSLMNHGLTQHAAEAGVAATMWRVRLTS
jgi:hypothetical protein